MSFSSVEHHICSLNGEIRIQSNRYGGGWMCVILLEELTTDQKVNQFNEMFDDMVGGDNDYFVALEWFKKMPEFVLGYGDSPSLALNNTMIKALDAIGDNHG